MKLREWLVQHLPAWLLPFNPWGAQGRPEMPEKHAVVNKQQALSLRLDRLARQAQREAEERRRYAAWEDESGG